VNHAQHSSRTRALLLGSTTSVAACPVALAVALSVALAITVPGPSIAQAPAPEKRFSTGDELVQLDFRDVELAVVVETIARITGKNFIYDDRVRGRVTIVSPSEVSVDQAYAVFESVLKIKGFTAVPGPGGVLKIVPVRDAKESSIETIQDDRESANRDNFVTRLVPLLYISAEAITNTIKPLVSKDASMVAYQPTNTIIMTDTEANIRRLLTILKALDVESFKEELAVIKVKHAEAATLANQISEIYGAEVASGTPSRSSSSRSTAASRRSSARSSTSSQSATVGPNRGKVRIMTDERTNSLLVLTSKVKMEDIRALVQKLDVPLVGSGRIHVHYLNHADSEEMANTLTGMLSGQRAAPTAGRTGQSAGSTIQNLRSQVTALSDGITLNADPPTNSLVIQASKESYEALVRVIEQLDIPRPQVLVEALILEVDITDNEELGMAFLYHVSNGDQQFFISTGADIAAMSTTGVPAGTLSDAVSSTLGGVLQREFDPSKPGGDDNKGTNFGAIIKAAANNSNLNLVSAPHILTSDNEEAEIRIGNNIPIITSRVNSATGNTAGLATSVNVERMDIGVTLRVTPQISEGNTLRLKIFQELTDINSNLVEDVGDPSQVGVSLFNRKVENTVVVRDGETIVIGGLISDRWADSVQKVPWLGDIPVAGWAFKTVTKKLRKINLLIFLTPRIVRNPDEMIYETILKRSEFEDAGGDRYKSDAETLERLRDDPEVADDKWSNTHNPVLGRLQSHSRTYSLERKEAIESEMRDSDARRTAARLERERVGGIRYVLRIDVYRDTAEAMAELTRLLDAGYEGALISGESGGSLYYELLIGPYPDMRSVQDASAVLEEVYGYEPTVTLIEQPRQPGNGSSAPDTRRDAAPLEWESEP
jgi:general secretion pathway protein D